VCSRTFFALLPIVLAFKNVSLSQGNYWTKIPAPSVGVVYALAEAPNGTIYIGTSHGVFQSTDGLLTWRPFNGGLSDTVVRSLQVAPNNTIFAATWSGIFRRKTTDSSWSILAAPGLLREEFATPFLIDSSSQLLLGTSNGLYLSVDQGNTWNSIKEGYIYSVVSQGNGILYASTNDGFYQSTNNGVTWSRTFSFPRYTAFISLSTTTSGTLLAAFADGYQGSIRRSIDGGSTWVAVEPGGYISNFAINSEGEIFLGKWKTSFGDPGVFRSRNDGLHWSALDDGLPHSSVRALIITGNDHVLIGMDDGTIYKTTQSTVSWIAHQRQYPPSGFVLDQNFPNPFNTQTRFTFSIPGRTITTLSIFNALGQYIMTLFSQELDPGTHSFLWSAYSIPSGVYIYHLSAGPLSLTRKAILLK